MKWFQGGRVLKAHRLVYHSPLGLSVIKNNKKKYSAHVRQSGPGPRPGFRVKVHGKFEEIPSLFGLGVRLAGGNLGGGRMCTTPRRTRGVVI